MADEKCLEQAKVVFATLCQALDKDAWRYQKDEEKLSITCSARGDDLPVEISVRVDPERMLVMLFSHLPFVISEEKRLEVAVAICAINDMLSDGSFDYDVTSGHIFFRISNSFLDRNIGGELLIYMLLCACHVVDAYNDKLLMLGKGMISLEQFLTKINE